MELTWRALTEADIPAATKLMAAAEAVDQTGENYSEADMTEEFTDPGTYLCEGTVGVLDGDELIAFGIVHTRSNAVDLHRPMLWGTVHPDHRRQGIGRAMVEKHIAQAELLHHKLYPGMPLVVGVSAEESLTANIALFEGLGFTAVRWYLGLRMSLTDPVPLVEEPGGLTVVPYTCERDEQVRLARNDSFSEHFGTDPASPEIWALRFTGRDFVPEASFLMLDGDTIAGFVLAKHFPADAEAKGHRELWISDVGTLAPYRGRGIAAALLSRVLAEAREQKYDKAALHVDSANSTRALGVYERAGFSLTTTQIVYDLPVPYSG